MLEKSRFYSQFPEVRRPVHFGSCKSDFNIRLLFCSKHEAKNKGFSTTNLVSLSQLQAQQDLPSFLSVPDRPLPGSGCPVRLPTEEVPDSHFFSGRDARSIPGGSGACSAQGKNEAECGLGEKQDQEQRVLRGASST